jgi:hypothetical protein
LIMQEELVPFYEIVVGTNFGEIGIYSNGTYTLLKQDAHTGIINSLKIIYTLVKVLASIALHTNICGRGWNGEYVG